MAPTYNKNLVGDYQNSAPNENNKEHNFVHFQVNGEWEVVSIRELQIEESLEVRLEAECSADAYYSAEAETKKLYEEAYMAEQQKIEDTEAKLQEEHDAECLREWQLEESAKRNIEFAEFAEYERAEALKSNLLREEYERELADEQILTDAQLELQMIEWFRRHPE